MKRVLRLPATVLTLMLATACATVSLDEASCPSNTEVDELVSRFVALQPAPNPSPAMTAEGAACGRDKFTQRLGQHLGPVVGYKAGLTNTAVQKRFDYFAPVRGTLFEKMIVSDGAVVPAKFGARPLYEADLVVVVRSSEIHNARTPLEVLQQITAIRPFIELPDLVLEDPSKINGPALTFVNVGARMGVIGAPITVRGADPALAEALKTM
ncbi:MAG TPA: fumarylacetoacetate hydrolase, partial [Burkholderiaceae bacterium]|nr:fumarylacetoacetate hydrolase [Burkholderiaceae bacterium]